MKLPISIGILSWNSDKTLRNTLNSYQKNGLFDIVNDVKILFQEATENDIKIANEYNISYISLQENIGIGAAFIRLAQEAQSEYVMLLEHDWELIENPNITYQRLKEGIDFLQSGYSSIRYRHRKNPGHPLYTLEPYKGNELTFYDPTTDLISPHLLDAIHWVEFPEKEFYGKIEKHNEWFITTSRWGNWTNNPCLYKKEFFLEAITRFIGSGIELERNISKWWAESNFKVAHGEGLFTHNDIQKYEIMNRKNLTVFYHLFIPEPSETWVWWIEEQMGLLKSTGLADNADVFLCTTIPLGLVNQKNNKSFDEMVFKYINDNYPFVKIIDVRGTHEEFNIFEGQTLKKLWDYCQSYDGYVLYFHNKGMNSYGTHIPGAVHDWKELLNYFSLEKWKDCVNKLDEGYDCVGINWLGDKNLAGQKIEDDFNFICHHFAGNFWWANSKYIRTLPDPLDFDKYCDVEFMMKNMATYRYAFEVWIGRQDTKYYSFHQTNTHHYFEYYPREKYDGSITKDQSKDPIHIINLIGAKNQFNWKKHITFAQWIVNHKKPEVVVDLGVDYAYSTFCFGIPKIGKIYGIDSFEGDVHAGIRNTYDFVQEKKKELGFDHITFIKGYFDDVAKTWDKPIDILHIDGLHTYEAVKNDYETWTKFLKDDGIVLFHDTCVNSPEFGVRKLFKEINLPKVNFGFSNGLGVVSKDINLMRIIVENFKNNLEFVEGV